MPVFTGAPTAADGLTVEEAEMPENGDEQVASLDPGPTCFPVSRAPVALVLLLAVMGSLTDSARRRRLDARLRA